MLALHVEVQCEPVAETVTKAQMQQQVRIIRQWTLCESKFIPAEQTLAAVAASIEPKKIIGRSLQRHSGGNSWIGWCLQCKITVLPNWREFRIEIQIPKIFK